MRYIGCKTLLLDYIHDLINKKAPSSKSFCDVFSGTATVARYFKRFYEVYSNDILYFSYCLQMATIENPSKPTFLKLKEHYGFDDPIDYINNLSNEFMEILPKEKRFFQNNYSPLGGRMYITDENALRIDYSRNIIEEWKEQQLINTNEYFYLVASVIEGIPFVSNISGTYGAYHKKWDKRAFKKFELIKIDVFNNGKNNRCYNENGVDLLEKIEGDILYIDPPYNERQYLPNYHLLETSALYDYPILKGVTGQRAYKENQKSEFCSLKTALGAFERLIKNARFKHIILSYNTDGIMPIQEIESIMKKYGKAETFEITYIDYRRYKSRSNVSNTSELKEMLIYIEKE